MEEVLNSTVRTYVFFNNILFSAPLIVLGVIIFGVLALIIIENCRNLSDKKIKNSGI